MSKTVQTANILFQNALVVAQKQKWNAQKRDIWVKDGKIYQIREPFSIEPDDRTRVLASPHLCVSAGFLELHCFSGAPGAEHTETLESLRMTAAAGGFVQVAVMPSTMPIMQTSANIQFFMQQAHSPVELLPVGALSKDLAGKQLTELLDMHKNGAVAFSDGHKPIKNALLLLKGLLYASSFQGVLIQRPEYADLAENGQMHEGEISTLLGMKGLPALAEEVMLLRDLAILRETKGRLHLTGISTQKSVEIIRQAKKEGLKVTCDVPSYLLTFNHQDLQTYDTNLKLKPPLRRTEDQKALQDALLDGTIDAISSFHQPLDHEHKVLEFDLASFGMINLQTSFASALTATAHQLPLEVLAHTFSNGARHCLGLPSVQLVEGEAACLTAFDTEEMWTFGTQTNCSLSENSPFLGQQLKGKIKAVVNKELLILV
ncbi:MAG: dihydroorotase [Cytophagales bacterium]|nr:MAG: dihydroorotase [Cytophagales bacterium]TAF60472.1 MAG: dihydroorotase [Cytophagales bacterium]